MCRLLTAPAIYASVYDEYGPTDICLWVENEHGALVGGNFMPTEEEFAAELLVLIQLKFPGRAIEVTRNPLRLMGPTTLPTSLSRAFELWLETAESQRSIVLENLVLSIFQKSSFPSTLAEASDHLMVRIRDRSSGELNRLWAAAEGVALSIPVEQPIADHLRAVLVLDSEHSIRELPESVLERWQCTPADALEIALQNLKRTGGGFVTMWPGVYRAEGRDNYDASRLLLDEVRDLKVIGRPLAFATHRDLLVVCGDEDVDGLCRVVEELEEHGDHSHPISVNPVVLDRGHWRTFEFPNETPVTSRFRALQAREAVNIYGGDTEWRNKLHARERRAERAVELDSIEDANGQPFTSCIWEQGIVSWLPESQLISFVDSKQNVVGQVATTTVQRVSGFRMTKVHTYPARYRVNSFPSPAEFAAMGL